MCFTLRFVTARFTRAVNLSSGGDHLWKKSYLKKKKELRPPVPSVASSPAGVCGPLRTATPGMRSGQGAGQATASQSRVARNKARREWRRGVGGSAPIGSRSGGGCRGQSGPWRVVRCVCGGPCCRPPSSSSRCPPQAVATPPAMGARG